MAGLNQTSPSVSPGTGSSTWFSDENRRFLDPLFTVLNVGLFVLMLYILCRISYYRSRSSNGTTTASFSFYNPTEISLPTARLNSDVLSTLPIFVYVMAADDEKLECAVCLTEFENGEKGRLLPGCNHKFHVACIDMWFASHSTCPICRSRVEANVMGSDEAV
ncbi:RING-H2 finger protein [Musa troglodytarum]|uniref:RING-type E3 ubiquitin transferase n=1 Tax=Musa troglodytarum TaxID=320322 RepID=A0A9E7FVF9_9LILI|nr:RING-H2 finger protein [Musa troglodytarum]